MNKTGRSMTLVISVVLILATAVPGFAKEGFLLGFQMPINDIEGDFDNRTMPAIDSGAGLGLIVGFGVTPAFSLELDWAGSGHRSDGVRVGFGEVSLNGKYAFFSRSDVQPFLFFGIGSFVLRDDARTLSGGGVNLGLGLDIYSSSNLSWGIAVITKSITYDTVERGDDILRRTGDLKGDTASLRLDVTGHF